MNRIHVEYLTPDQLKPGSNPSGQPIAKKEFSLGIDFSMYRATAEQVIAHVPADDPEGQAAARVLLWILRDAIVRNMINQRFQPMLTELKDAGTIDAVHVALE